VKPDLLPCHDTPTCTCGGPMVGIGNAHWNHRADDGDRIVCCACGDGRPGTEAEASRRDGLMMRGERRRQR
jgi:hypothetical protein